MSHTPEPKKTDSLGRKRLEPEQYSQSGGWRKPRHIVWTCKVCSRAWNVSSKSSRYDSKCRQCGTRNSILLSTASDAEWNAKVRNEQWMRRRTKRGYGTNTFVKASELNKKRNTEGSFPESGKK